MRIQVRLILALSIASCAALAAQDASIEWRVGTDVTANDKKSILELARTVGMERPRRVSTSPPLAPGCHVVIVTSDPIVDGNHVTWTGIDLLRADSKNCWPQRNAPRRVGRWIANTAQPWSDERWRIHDGDWSIDVQLDEGVPYRDAERIVLAIRRGQLINRLPDGSKPAQVDAEQITSIQKRNVSGTEYRVTVGLGRRGTVLDVRVAEARVELNDQRGLGEI